MKSINRFFKDIISFIYPNTCVGCGEIIVEGEFFCDYCYEMLDNISTDKQCFKCGRLKKECECKRRVFSFDGAVSPYHNDGVARTAMYTYKLNSRPYLADFFAHKMALAVKYAFYDVEFHGICYVPVSKRSFMKRGFDQSRILAEKLSEILCIPLIVGQLECYNKRKGQHSAKGKERFENVKGAFRSRKKCIGNILLVDDIKTTGATLNECAKQLINSGADSVYCVTGLISKGKKNKKRS